MGVEVLMSFRELELTRQELIRARLRTPLSERSVRWLMRRELGGMVLLISVAVR